MSLQEYLSFETNVFSTLTTFVWCKIKYFLSFSQYNEMACVILQGIENSRVIIIVMIIILRGTSRVAEVPFPNTASQFMGWLYTRGLWLLGDTGVSVLFSYDWALESSSFSPIQCTWSSGNRRPSSCQLFLLSGSELGFVWSSISTPLRCSSGSLWRRFWGSAPPVCILFAPHTCYKKCVRELLAVKLALKGPVTSSWSGQILRMWPTYKRSSALINARPGLILSYHFSWGQRTSNGLFHEWEPYLTKTALDPVLPPACILTQSVGT